MTVKRKNFVCLDLGTSKIVVYVSGRGIVFNEASIIAYNAKNNEPLFIGNDAASLEGKSGPKTKIIKPIISGVIYDMRAARDYLKMLATKINIPNMWKNSIVLFSCPSGITELEKMSLKGTGNDLGADTVIVKSAIEMAALGAGVDVNSPKGHLILDMGAGSTDIAVISSGETVISENVKFSDETINRRIFLYGKTHYSIILGISVIKIIRHKLGTLKKDDLTDKKYLNIVGSDAISGLPKEVQITSLDILKILRSEFTKVSELIANILEKTPPDLTYDVVNNGITICGGLAHIRGIRDFLQNIFKFKINLPEHPELSAIKGAIRLENELPRLISDAKIDSSEEFKIK